MTIKRVLVPVDFSERSRAALEHADAVARRFGSELELLHAIPAPSYEYAVIDEGFATPSSGPPVEQLKEAVEERLDALIAEAAPRSPVHRLIVHGDPAGAIISAAQSPDVDMICMPTHGYGPFRRFALGSVTTKVLHDTDKPVLTGQHVPEIAFSDLEPYKRVACAIDLDAHGEEVLWWAAQFSKACANDLVVIHAAPWTGPVSIYGEWVPPDTRTEVVARAREEVERMLAKVGAKAQVVVDAGSPAEFIASAAKENYADLLVIGRSQKGGLLPGLRAHAGAIIREASCPVISI